jgi:hypothetical protein
MSDSTDYTIQLFEENSIGDDAGKHNFNALSLESKICNLSGEFFSPDNIFISSFTEFLSDAYELEDYAKILNLGKTYSITERFNKIATSVALLSSYWEAYELTTILPVNLSLAFHPSIRQFQSDLNFQTKRLVALTPQSDLDTVLSVIKAYLQEYHPLQNYNLNSKINVTIPFYSRLYDPEKPESASVVSLSNEFSHFNREMTAQVYRKGTNFVSSKIYKFIRGPVSWNLINIICPLPLTSSNTSLTGRQIVELSIDANTSNYDIALNARQNPNYVAGKSEVVLTVQPGVRVYSTTPTAPALILGNLDDNDTITLFNYGLILGAGGQGGTGGNGEGVGSVKPSGGADGGTAIAVFASNTIIENQGAIYGGGGGGAGGLGGVAGSATSGGGGGGGAGYTPGESGYRGITQRLVNRFVLVQDAQPGSNLRGGKGGPGLTGGDALPSEEMSKIEGKKGGDVGMPGDGTYEVNADGDQVEIAPGGAAGAYVLGNNNVIWLVKGDVKGRAV